MNRLPTSASREAGENGNPNHNNFDKMMNDIKATIDNLNTYTFRECIHRNIVLIGRTRTGKSTVSKVLHNPLYVPELGSLYSETRQISFNQIAAMHENKACYFNIIDSPGLYDNTLQAGEHLTNENIQKHINECITKDVTHIHVFAFVFSSIGGINTEDIQSMIFIKEKYPQLKEFFILLITHGEEKDEEERNTFVEAFFQHRDVVKYGLQDFFGLGFYFMGCLRPQLRRVPNTLSARIQIENVLEMRRVLLDFLITRETTFNIHRPAPAPALVSSQFLATFMSTVMKVLIVLVAFLIFLVSRK